MAIFTNGQNIGKYHVQSLIKENLYTETYRVEDDDHNPYFLKAYLIKTVPEKLVNKNTGKVLEIEQCENIKHKNVVSFIDCGEMNLEEGKVQYYLTNYLSGEILADKIQREGPFPEEIALEIFRGILDGLLYLHDRKLCHNDITPRNIMLSTTLEIEPQIIDLGHISSYCNGKVPFDVSDLEPQYCANETFVGMYDQQSDIFSATAVLYAMLSGKSPWTFQMSGSRSKSIMQLKEFRKANPLDFSDLDISERTKALLNSGLALNFHNRAKDIDQLISILDSVSDVPDVSDVSPKTSSNSPKRNTDDSTRRSNDSKETDESDPNDVEFDVKCGGGNGFQDIAGMNDLKEYLSKKIIFVIKNQEMAKRYRLTPPNAMLLYGPPGCGKTFVAEKFAEETQFNYILVKASDLASSYVHGSQQKIAKLFKQAEKKAPIVICFDEFDAFVPDRSQTATQFVAGEVNEFLSQLNNCSQRGIFVVATTNRPDKIDPAVLRTGRIDRQVYVPLPDTDARTEMFKLHIKGRPFDEEAIDFDKLSEMTDGYIASDIAYVVNDAAMVAAFTGQDITEELLIQSINNTRPSLRKGIIEQYERMRQAMEGAEREQWVKPVGFDLY